MKNPTPSESQPQQKDSKLKKSTSRPKKAAVTRGNIKDEPEYDPFPPTGLVKQFEPKIRKEVREYHKQYPRLRYEELLIEAVKIAVNCEKRFDPKLGNSFWTLLVWHLKALHRFAEHEFNAWQLPPSKAQLIEERRNGIGGEDPRPANFSGGGNGARVTFDYQWATSPITRHRIVLGTQLRGNDWGYATGVV